MDLRIPSKADSSSPMVTVAFQPGENLGKRWTDEEDTLLKQLYVDIPPHAAPKCRLKTITNAFNRVTPGPIRTTNALSKRYRILNNPIPKSPSALSRKTDQQGNMLFDPNVAKHDNEQLLNIQQPTATTSAPCTTATQADPQHNTNGIVGQLMKYVNQDGHPQQPASKEQQVPHEASLAARSSGSPPVDLSTIDWSPVLTDEMKRAVYNSPVPSDIEFNHVGSVQVPETQAITETSVSGQDIADEIMLGSTWDELATMTRESVQTLQGRFFSPAVAVLPYSTQLPWTESAIDFLRQAITAGDEWGVWSTASIFNRSEFSVKCQLQRMRREAVAFQEILQSLTAPGHTWAGEPMANSAMEVDEEVHETTIDRLLDFDKNPI